MPIRLEKRIEWIIGQIIKGLFQLLFNPEKRAKEFSDFLIKTDIQ